MPVVSTLVVSGKTAERIASTAGVLADWMDGDAGAEVGLAEVAHTLNHHRARHGKFATVAARERAQAVAGLRALAGGIRRRGWSARMRARAGRARCLCIPGRVRSGRGWAGELLADEPVFAAAVAELEPVFVEQVGFSLRQVLAAGEPLVGIDRIQPVLVGVQLALTALWRCYGVTPGCGDRAFDGRGDRGGGGRGAEPGRRAAGDRHPLAADGPAGRARRDGAAGAGPGPPRR